MTIKDVAEILNVQYCTVRNYIRRGVLPAVRVEGLVRIRPEEFRRFVGVEASGDE